MHLPRAGRMALLILGAALAPAVAAIWLVPWFVTQDGPAHVYNAEILASSVGGFDRTSPWHNVYTVRWQPIPNWAGPVCLAGLVAWLPAWLADRIMTSVTLVGFAVAILWLRWRVAGGRVSAHHGALGLNPFHEHGLALRVYQLHARGLPVPDHTRGVVAGSRSVELASSRCARRPADTRVFLSSRESWADRAGADGAVGGRAGAERWGTPTGTSG